MKKIRYREGTLRMGLSKAQCRTLAAYQMQQILEVYSSFVDVELAESKVKILLHNEVKLTDEEIMTIHTEIEAIARKWHKELDILIKRLEYGE